MGEGGGGGRWVRMRGGGRWVRMRDGGGNEKAGRGKGGRKGEKRLAERDYLWFGGFFGVGWGAGIWREVVVRVEGGQWGG